MKKWFIAITATEEGNTTISCFEAFESTFKLKKLTLPLPLELLEKFVEGDNTKMYSENIDALIKKILFFEKIADRHYNSNHVITNM